MIKTSAELLVAESVLGTLPATEAACRAYESSTAYITLERYAGTITLRSVPLGTVCRPAMACGVPYVISNARMFELARIAPPVGFERVAVNVSPFGSAILPGQRATSISSVRMPRPRVTLLDVGET